MKFNDIKNFNDCSESFEFGFPMNLTSHELLIHIFESRL